MRAALPMRAVLICGIAVLPCARAAERRLADVVREEGGRLLVTPWPVDEALRNPWPRELEEEFRARGDAILRAQSEKPMTGASTYFENEKRAYGLLMAQVLGGHAKTALAALQAEDAQAAEWHRETAGIDYYACFTLKHQIRKYFFFGDLLDPAYRRRMFEGAKSWTAQDPLRRPHYAYKGPGDGWGPDVKNSWVDVRSTENLFLMRVTSVYLLAEATGNEATRLLYRAQLLRYASDVYRVGIGEWDSENYLGHCVAPLLNLHDFAKDPAVKLAAKAVLDFATASGAVKYYRGGFNGPTKRDYNHVQPFGGSAPSILWVYFGDCPRENRAFESDEVHLLTSSYRPPLAVVNVARKNFDRPVELFAAKAHYEASVAHELGRGPQYLETQYFGRTYQFGSLVGGTSSGAGDVNGWKIMAFDGRRGVADIQCCPGPDPRYMGSPRYTAGKIAAENRVAQHKNMAVWLVAAGDAPWCWTLPTSVAVAVEGGVTFLRCERTWIALRPLGITQPAVDAALGAAFAAGVGKEPGFPEHQVLTARGAGGKYCGFALEIGEAPTEFAAFRRDVIARGRLDAAELDAGIAAYTGSDGRTVKLAFGAAAADTRVWRDGEELRRADHGAHLFANPDGSDAPLRCRWLGGTLQVRAGGAAFRGTVDEDGRYTFANE
jgi:hypothetical protein